LMAAWMFASGSLLSRQILMMFTPFSTAQSSHTIGEVFVFFYALLQNRMRKIRAAIQNGDFYPFAFCVLP
jgi:hypothetical protein